MSLPDTFFKEGGTIDKIKMEKLKWYTGYLPREIQKLKEKGDFQSFEMARIADFRSRANTLYKNCTKQEQEEFNTFLISTMIPRYEGQSTNLAIGSFYDKGLFYRSDRGIYECISGPARKALMPLLSNALMQKLPPIDSETVGLPL
jgi:hypothetical protein